MNKQNIDDIFPIKSMAKMGWIVLAIFVVGFLLWAFLASIESAAIAPGKVVVAGNRRVVQHLEGGIVSEIFVKNGLEVKKGEVLLKIDDTQSSAKFELEHGELLRLLAEETRLLALINDQEKIIFPKILLSIKNTEMIKKILATQEKSFLLEHQTKMGTLKIYQQRILQLQEQIKGAEAQLAASDQQLKLVHQEVQALLKLAKEELVDRSRVLSMQREEQRLLGEQGEYHATIAGLKQKIGETELLVIQEKNKLNQAWDQELREVQNKLAQSEDRERAAKDIFERTTITAPIDGTAMNVAVTTIGSVVKSGETLLEIVPKHEELVVEARVSPLDIDVVHEGLTAKVTLSALKTRTTPMLLGKVIYVSADAKEDPRTEKQYFEARIEINPEELKKLGKQMLVPGMPAEVMIITNQETPWNYFMDPIERSFHRAFRED